MAPEQNERQAGPEKYPLLKAFEGKDPGTIDSEINDPNIMPLEKFTRLCEEISEIYLANQDQNNRNRTVVPDAVEKAVLRRLNTMSKIEKEKQKAADLMALLKLKIEVKNSTVGDLARRSVDVRDMAEAVTEGFSMQMAAKGMILYYSKNVEATGLKDSNALLAILSLDQIRNEKVSTIRGITSLEAARDYLKIHSLPDNDQRARALWFLSNVVEERYHSAVDTEMQDRPAAEKPKAESEIGDLATKDFLEKTGKIAEAFGKFTTDIHEFLESKSVTEALQEGFMGDKISAALEKALGMDFSDPEKLDGRSRIALAKLRLSGNELKLLCGYYAAVKAGKITMVDLDGTLNESFAKANADQEMLKHVREAIRGMEDFVRKDALDYILLYTHPEVISGGHDTALRQYLQNGNLTVVDVIDLYIAIHQAEGNFKELPKTLAKSNVDGSIMMQAKIVSLMNSVEKSDPEKYRGYSTNFKTKLFSNMALSSKLDLPKPAKDALEKLTGNADKLVFQSMGYWLGVIQEQWSKTSEAGNAFLFNGDPEGWGKQGIEKGVPTYLVATLVASMVAEGFRQSYEVGAASTSGLARKLVGNDVVRILKVLGKTLNPKNYVDFREYYRAFNEYGKSKIIKSVVEIESALGVKFPAARMNQLLEATQIPKAARGDFMKFTERMLYLEAEFKRIKALNSNGPARTAALDKFSRESVHPFMREFNAFTDANPEARRILGQMLLDKKITDLQWAELLKAHNTADLAEKSRILKAAGFGDDARETLVRLGVAGNPPQLEGARSGLAVLESLDNIDDVTRVLQELGANERLLGVVRNSPESVKVLAAQLKAADDPQAALKVLNAVVEQFDAPQAAQLLSTEGRVTRLLRASDAPLTAAKAGKMVKALNALGVVGDVFAIWIACEDMKETDRLMNQEGISEGLRRQYGNRYYYHAAEIGVAGTGIAAVGLGAAGVISGTVATPVVIATLPVSMVIGAAYQGQKWEEDKARTAEDWAKENDEADLIMNMQEYGFGERVGHAWAMNGANGRWVEQLNPLGQMYATSQYLNRSREILGDNAQKNRKMIRALVLHTSTVQVPEQVMGENGEPRGLTDEESKLYQRTADVYVNAKVDYILQNGGGDAIYGIDSSANIAQLLRDADNFAQHTQMAFFLSESKRPLPEGMTTDGSMKDRAEQFAKYQSHNALRGFLQQAVVTIGLARPEQRAALQENLQNQIAMFLAERSKPSLIDFEVRARNANFESWWSDGDAIDVVRRYLMEEYVKSVNGSSKELATILFEDAQTSLTGSAAPGLGQALEQKLADAQSRIDTLFSADPRKIWEQLPESARVEVRRRQAEVQKFHESMRQISGWRYKNDVKTVHLHEGLPHQPDSKGTVYIRSGSDTGGQTVYYMHSELGKEGGEWLWSLDLEEWSDLRQVRNGRAFHRPLLNAQNEEFNHRMLQYHEEKDGKTPEQLEAEHQAYMRNLHENRETHDRRYEAGVKALQADNATDQGGYFTKHHGYMPFNKHLYVEFDKASSKWLVGLGSREKKDPRDVAITESGVSGFGGAEDYNKLIKKLRDINDMQ